MIRRLPVLIVIPFFAWYDLWIGVFIDYPRRLIYICPLPMVGIKIHWEMEDV